MFAGSRLLLPVLHELCYSKITQLLPKMTAGDDVEAFLQIFENTATQEGWESDDWAWLLAPLLTVIPPRVICFC